MHAGPVMRITTSVSGGCWLDAGVVADCCCSAKHVFFNISVLSNHKIDLIEGQLLQEIFFLMWIDHSVL